MWEDPIVTETRKRREEYAAKFGHDPDAIFDDIRKRQRQKGKKLVSFPPTQTSMRSRRHMIVGWA